MNEQHRKSLINAIGSGDESKIEEAKDKAEKNVKVYTSLTNFYQDCLGAASLKNPKEMGEYELQLLLEDQEKLNLLLQRINQRKEHE